MNNLVMYKRETQVCSMCMKKALPFTFCLYFSLPVQLYDDDNNAPIPTLSNDKQQ